MTDAAPETGDLAAFRQALGEAARAAGIDPELALAMIGSAPPEEMGDRRPEEIVAALQALIALAGTRRQGQPAIRLFNPDQDSDGFSSEHSILHIVNDDMPFLVDSVTGMLNRNDMRVHLVMHPVLPAENGTAQSLMHVEIDRVSAQDAIELLQTEVAGALADVRAAVEDWRTMLERVDAAIAETKSSAVPRPAGSRRSRCCAGSRKTCSPFSAIANIRSPHRCRWRRSAMAKAIAGAQVRHRTAAIWRLAAWRWSAAPDWACCAMTGCRCSMGCAISLRKAMRPGAF